MPGFFQNFIAGEQAGLAKQQQQFNNQLAQRQQGMAEEEFGQRQQEFAQRQQALKDDRDYNQLAARYYLGNDTVDVLGVPSTGGPPAQAVPQPQFPIAQAPIDESEGPPQYPQQQQQAAPAQAGQPALLSQLVGMNPARALELEKARAQRAQQKHEVIYNLASRTLQNGKPAAGLKYLLAVDNIDGVDIKSYRESLERQGYVIKDLNDDQATGILKHLIATSAGLAGIKTPEPYNLSQGMVRFDGGNRPVASVPAAPSDKDPTDRKFARANQLRDEYFKQTGVYEALAGTYNKILAATRDPSIAGDIALVFHYMKILDPTSTVAKGEQAEANNAGNVPQRIQSLYNSLILGESKLDAKIRADFVSKAKETYGAQRELYQKKRANYSKLATRAEVDPIDVIGDDIGIDDAVGGSAPADTGKPALKTKPAQRDYSKLSDADLLKEAGL